jgi:hypothetical protein
MKGWMIIWAAIPQAKASYWRKPAADVGRCFELRTARGGLGTYDVPSRHTRYAR